MNIHTFTACLFLSLSVSCTQGSNNFSDEEKRLIDPYAFADADTADSTFAEAAQTAIADTGAANIADSVMRVLSAADTADIKMLRRKADPVSKRMVRSPEFELLCRRMLRTVRDPANDGIGIAAPQVGISRRIIIVQRLDKEGEPFEVYVNPEIVTESPERTIKPEGCLSVLRRPGMVERACRITVRYNDPETFEKREEGIYGRTAAIFQHETDHLNGTLYTDKTLFFL